MTARMVDQQRSLVRRRTFLLPEQRSAVTAEMVRSVSSTPRSGLDAGNPDRQHDQVWQRLTESAPSTPRRTTVAGRTPASERADLGNCSDRSAAASNAHGTSEASGMSHESNRPTWIFKPTGGSQGRGIQLLQSEVRTTTAASVPAGGGSSSACVRPNHTCIMGCDCTL